MSYIHELEPEIDLVKEVTIIWYDEVCDVVREREREAGRCMVS